MFLLRAGKKAEANELRKKRKQNQGKRKCAEDDVNRLKNFECKRFKKGLCTLGDTCKYSHPSQDLLESKENDEEK